jgi:hypothetical protein
MHQVRLLALYKIVPSDLFQRPNLTMILYLSQTMSPPLGIPDSEIKSAMARGVYDLLTVIPIDQLEKGVVLC